MDISDVKQVLRGPMIPELSCLDSNLAVDHGATRANVQTTVERGIVNGRGVLLAVGAGGDFPMLSLLSGSHPTRSERRLVVLVDTIQKRRFSCPIGRHKITDHFWGTF